MGNWTHPSMEGAVPMSPRPDQPAKANGRGFFSHRPSQSANNGQGLGSPSFFSALEPGALGDEAKRLQEGGRGRIPKTSALRNLPPDLKLRRRFLEKPLRKMKARPLLGKTGPPSGPERVPGPARGRAG